MKIALTSLKRLAIRALGLSALAATAALAPSQASAQARTDVQPYIEVQQVLNADLENGDTLTYTGIALGVDAQLVSRRVQAQVSYRYEKRIGWGEDLANDDIHSGIAQVRAEVIPNTLQIGAGALATRSRGDASGPIFGVSNIDDVNVADVYSFYAGPDFTKRIGDVDVAASYRFGWVEVDDHSLRLLPQIPGQVQLDHVDRSINHSASASVGMGVGALPFGWTIGGGWVREDVDRLDQDYEAKYVRGDIVVPVSRTLALTAGVGYETIESSQQDILRDAAGVPIVTPGGNFIADPTKPRLRSFENDGWIYDAGIIWRPSRRTELQARIGHRYGGTTFTGSFSHQINKSYAVSASVYDTVESYGRLLVTDLAGVPVNFRTRRNTGFDGGVGGIGGCVFGTEPGTGTCFDDSFQTISNANFRNRGASILFSGERGPWGFGVGASYTNRKYFSPIVTADGGFDGENIVDESWSLSASASRALTRTSGIGLDAYAGLFNSGIQGVDNSFGTGITASYYQSFIHERLQGTAAIGLFHSGSDRFDSTVASATVGLRYTF